MNSDLLKTIENNISNLRFSIEFDRWDLNVDQQEAMLKRLDDIEQIVLKVKNESKV